MDSDIIELLNDIGHGRLQDDVFIDDDGEPTDHFLQTLKTGKRSEQTRSRISARETHSASGTRSLHGDKTNSVSKSRSLGGGKSVASASSKSRSTTRKTESYSASGVVRKKSGKSVGGAISADSLVVNKKPYIGVRTSRATELRIKKGIDHAASAEKQSIQASTGSSIAFTAHQRAREKLFDKHAQNLERIRKSSGVSVASGTTTTRSGKSGKSVRYPQQQLEIEELELAEMEEAEIAADIAMETRMKTLQLRLSGQQQTIKRLEEQLQRTTKKLDDKNRQVSHADMRVKAMQHELAREQKKASLRVQENARIVDERRGDLLEKFKAQNDLLHAQIDEEQMKRRKTDDRVRVLKEFGEKAKIRIKELESQLQETSSSEEGAKTHLLRFRQDNKTLHGEINALKRALTEQEEESVRHKNRAEKAEFTVRNLEVDSERMKEEIRILRKDLYSYTEQRKQQQMEMEILKQKHAKMLTEERIAAMRKGSTASNESQTYKRGDDDVHKFQESTLNLSLNENNRENETATDVRQSTDSIDASATVRVVKPQYNLPHRGKSGEPSFTKSGSHKTAMGRRNARLDTSTMSNTSRSYLEEDDDDNDDDDDDEEDIDEDEPLAHRMPPPVPYASSSNVRSSTNSLEKALVTENMGLEDEDEVADGEDALSEDADAGRLELKAIAEGMQAKARAAAKAAEDSLRSSLESQSSDLKESRLGNIQSLMADRFKKLEALQKRY